MSQKYRFKGRFAVQSKVKNNLKRLSNLKRSSVSSTSKVHMENVTEDGVTEYIQDIGTRLVHLGHFAEHLQCDHCTKKIHVGDTHKEETSGLHSILHIKCKCGAVTEVPTGPTHSTEDNHTHADINSKVVLGAVHSGTGCTALNKLFACLNMPEISPALFKRSEREIGPVIEEVAKESCKRAVEE